jgi:hypothetical protein
MANDIDTSADELGRGFAALLKASRSIPDVMEMWRAFANLHAAARLRKQDAGEDLGPSPADPVVFVTRANSIMLRAGVELGLKWQDLLSRTMPAIRSKLDAYRDEEDPFPEDRQALLTEITRYLQELKCLVEDSGRSLQEDIDSLQRDLLPPDDPDVCNSNDGMPPRFGSMHE